MPRDSHREDWSLVTAALPAAVREVLAPGARVVVTGCAGFIGSHVTEALLALGCRVTGVDCLTDYYAPEQKREHLAPFLGDDRFEFRQQNLLDLDPRELLRGAAACFHLAAQAGVRASWGQQFEDYVHWNVLATQRLLEGCRDEEVAAGLRRFVYSSSSSVYGDQDVLPVTEEALPAPRSPYGVTKLAAEHLCQLYHSNFGVPVTSLRYFTVYGPRQRPDMAFRKYIEAALDGREFVVYGDGRQTRDFTFVTDAVCANLRAVAPKGAATVFNVGGGARVSLREVLDLLAVLITAEVADARTQVSYREVVAGDVRDTFAERSLVSQALGYAPTVPLREGLEREVAWVVERRRHA
ncbi:MAG: GDP-mannose 4,6-dehydratase [Candidatus Krumholzibacteriia bacterium]